MLILTLLIILTFVIIVVLSVYQKLSPIISIASINSIFLMLMPNLLYFTVPISAILLLPPLRMYIITFGLLKFIRHKQLLPQISETEEIALNAGNVWVEGEFFSGKPDFLRIIKEPYSEISDEEHRFLNNEVEELCNMVTDQQIHELQDLPHEVWEYIRKKGFFGMIIPKIYGGLEFSPIAQSKIVAKLATRSQVLSVTVMVPNSLGPAELLLKYGTESQKKYYIPRLANGTDIPCFALTEPHAGSDASSITSSGEVFLDEDDRLKIRLNFEKRYITLGGIATVIGLAFHLNDPKNLLPHGTKTGITCALFKGNIKGLTRGRRHMPMHVPFINSPLWGKNVIIDLEHDVIGGINGVGNGWKMLMECLAVGRGISLPAISYGGSVLASYVTLAHTTIRKQFGLPLIKFEAIQEKLADMLAKTYSIDAMRTFIASAIGVGNTPSVANAIVKYHATEHSRDIINHGMDCLGGSAICMGENNLLANLYLATPVGITVEGANILTRSLLQFGQGIIRCHPFLLNEVKAIQNNNLKDFDKYFFKHIHSFFSNFVRTFVLTFTCGGISKIFSQQNIIQKYNGKLNYISARFASLADYALITYGGTLKRKEFLSSRFADIASYMFLITSVLKKYTAHGMNIKEQAIVEYISDLYLQKIYEAFEQISTNIKRNSILGVLYFIGRVFTKKRIVKNYIKYKNIEEIIKLHLENGAFNREELFIPSHQNEQLNKMFIVFEQSKIIQPIEKRIKESGYRTLNDAFHAGVISENELKIIEEYNKICNEIVQVNHYELKSFIHNES